MSSRPPAAPPAPSCSRDSHHHAPTTPCARRPTPASRARRRWDALETDSLPALLKRQFDSPHWDDVAARCLACANCTLVCPTCFCSSVEDVSDLDGRHAERWRRWDSCFNPGFSYLHGGEVRRGTAARYRQWLTHKLATWHDQFGSSGCAGCGRCITGAGRHRPDRGGHPPARTGACA